MICDNPPSCIQRDTKEEDLKPEDYQQFKNLGSACLTKGDSEQLLTFLQDEKNQVFFSQQPMPMKEQHAKQLYPH